MDDTDKHFLDGTAVVVAAASVAKLLPAIAALFTIVWTGLRIFEWFRDKKWRGASK